ncbi:MAG: PSD1 domain-containing protein [Planctomycetales bacterium]|nr:PSD1 domain-containing protein [Planctomycetales bacterium]
MRSRTNRCASLAVALLIASALALRVFAEPPEPPGESTDPPQATAGEKLFALRVKPLLAEKCLACHGADPDDLQGGLDLRTRDGALRGGDSFPRKALLPGDGESSLLYLAASRAAEGLEMPPKEADRLTRQQTWWIRDWIRDGAPWPDDQRVTLIRQHYAEGEIVVTSGGLGEEWTQRRYDPADLWAYRPLQAVEPPPGHPIDGLLAPALAAAKLDPAPMASPRELARRISFGITGLPPAPEDVRSLESKLRRATSPQQQSAAVLDYARRLMATPHYGEQFGSHWLDVTRYADSAGFANDYARPNAWRYRDYVVRSLNSDKPFHRFIVEQLAGDELDAADPELLVATGFLRMGPWEQTGMSVFRVTRQQWLDDVTDSVGQTFLAHSLQCAKCHDHKFDPVPTRDYYRLAAVFSSTQFAARPAPFLPDENQQGFSAADDWTSAKIDAYREQARELEERMSRQRRQESGDAKVGDNNLAPGDEASLARMRKNITRHQWELEKTKPVALSVYTGATIQRNNVSGPLPLPPNPWGRGELEPDTILTGGDPFTRGAAVSPGPLSALESLAQLEPASFPAGRGARRLALARWIADPANPLTARVIVNRVWAWHFGRGLAANPNNFGATGAAPTHPLLLDYLAGWFIQHDGSIKQLNELIVTSEAYRRASRHPQPARLRELDPAGQLYATFLPRRLTAEELRDAMLWSSGELNSQVGGIPCRPEINREVAMQPRQIMGGTASVYEPDPLPRQRNRRTLYAEKIRGLRDPFLETFNQPGPAKSCELRETSTVAPQALTLFNSTAVRHRALAFADRLQRDVDGGKQPRAAVIRRAFELALGRPPSDAEASACLDRWRRAAESEQSEKPLPAAVLPDRIQRTVMAEKTGEPYEFTEELPAYRNYVPDLQPHQVDPSTRGLADVCLVLFNLNEFAYLD